MAAYLIEERLKMITCKEDLHNTWIKNDKGELRDLYISIASSFGIKNETCMGGLPFIGIFSEWGECGFVGNTSELLLGQESRKQLTIKDLKQEKPKPTKFVKVEESIFDLKDEFERGELFTKKAWGEYVLIKEDTHLASLYEMQSHENSKIGIYRQVEIDWRDELDSYLDSISSLDSNFDEKVTLEFSKSKFAYNMSDSEFVAACHLVASLTEKPTN